MICHIILIYVSEKELIFNKIIMTEFKKKKNLKEVKNGLIPFSIW